MNQPSKINDWKESLRQLPQLYKASEGDVVAIELFISQLLEKSLSTQRTEALEEVLKLMPKEIKVELEKPRLFQSNPQRNEFGGFSSVPFYCSLCFMSEMNIQDNKLENGNYTCHCSIWDNSCGGSWVGWYDKKEAEKLTSEQPSEDNISNSVILKVKDIINQLKNKEK